MRPFEDSWLKTESEKIDAFLARYKCSSLCDNFHSDTLGLLGLRAKEANRQKLVLNA